MNDDSRDARILFAICAVMFLYSLLMDWFAWRIGIHWTDSFVCKPPRSLDMNCIPDEQTNIGVRVKGFFQKPNWFLFPIYWPLVGLFVYFSWSLYLKGWR